MSQEVVMLTRKDDGDDRGAFESLSVVLVDREEFEWAERVGEGGTDVVCERGEAGE